MKIVVVGGTGLIGKPLVSALQDKGHEVFVASPSRGINSVTGEGLAEALKGADVVVDVSNSPSFEDGPVMEFFDRSTRNLLAAEKEAGVKRHVALSVVGTERMLAGGYFRAKMNQEKLIAESGVPYTIVRATQFFEFAGGIAYVATEGNSVRVPAAMMRPMAAADVSNAMVDLTLAEPVNGIAEIAGPEFIRQDDFIRRFLTAQQDARNVIADNNAGYFGNIPVNDESLVPSGANPVITSTRYEDWLKASAK